MDIMSTKMMVDAPGTAETVGCWQRMNACAGTLRGSPRDADERRVTADGSEAGLAAAQQRLWELSMDMLATANNDGYLTRVSPSWQRTLGWTAEELTSQPYTEFVHPDDLQATMDEAARCIAAGYITISFENRYRTKGGGWRWLSWKSSPAPDGELFCVVRDVTDKHAADDEFLRVMNHLEARELMLSGVIQNNQALIYVKDLDGRYLVYNEPFATACDLDRRGAAEGLPGLQVLLGRDDMWLDPALQPLWRANDVRAQLGRYEIEEWSDHPTRGRLTYNSVKFPLVDAAGAVYATCGVSLETTELMRAAQKHREAEELFRGSFEQSPIGMALIGPDGNVMRANSALADITGRSAEELSGASLLAMTAEKYVDENVAAMKRLASGEMTVYDRELELINAVGTPIWVQASSSTVRNDNGDLIYVIAQLQNISERKELEARLRHIADHDSLTGLRNRRIFDEDLASQVSRCQRYGEKAALLMIDLDGFKAVNDQYGHRFGDDLLRAISAALKHRLRTNDVIARLGGDEFAVMLPHIRLDQARPVAAAVGECIARASISVAGSAISVTASIGIAAIDEHTKDSETVMVAADADMYRQKATSRSQ